MDRTCYLDVETSKTPYHYPWSSNSFLSCVGIINADQERKIYWFNHRDIDVTKINYKEQIREIQAVIDSHTRLVGHNLAFDLLWLWHIGIDTSKIKCYDTQVGAYIISGQTRKMVSLNEECEHYKIPTKIDRVKMYWENGIDTDEVPINLLSEYLFQDLYCTQGVFLKQARDIKRLKLGTIIKLNMELMPILAEIKYNGMRLDLELCKKYEAEYIAKLAVIEKELVELLGYEINWDSPQQVSCALFGGTFNVDDKETYIFTYKDGRTTEKVRAVKKEVELKGLFKPPSNAKLGKSGYYSVGANMMLQLKGSTAEQKRFIALLQEKASISTNLETFFTGLQQHVTEDGKIHGNFNQSLTNTGRLSSSQPNQQNLPRKGTSPVKQVFLPAFDGIMNADLKQAEWRIGAYLSQDKVMINELINKVDIHTLNAQETFEDVKYRQEAKVVSFRMLYKGSAKAFYHDPKMPDFTLKRWEAIVSKFENKYPRLIEWQAENLRTITAMGQLRLPSGRIQKFSLQEQYGGAYGYSKTQAANYPVQGFTGDCMYVAMINIRKKMREHNLKSKIICQVHDSLVFDYSNEELAVLVSIVKEVYDNLDKYISKYFGIDFNVPMGGDIEIGETYGSLKAYEG